MKNLPKLVHVGPFRIAVEVRDLQELDDGVWGRWSAKDQRIYLHKEQERDMLADSLLHEVLHVVWMVAAIQKDTDDEETVVSRFSTILLDVFRRNPGLVKFLLEGGDK